MSTQKTLFERANIDAMRAKAEAAKQHGMALAADKRAEAVAAGQVALLRALMASDDGTATIDDATADLSLAFDGGGKWRGSIPSGLARKKIIKRVGIRKSDRPSRHRSFVSVWWIANQAKAECEIELLTNWLDANQKNPQSAATDAGKNSSQVTSSIEAATENATD